MSRTEPCLLCGGTITAEAEDFATVRDAVLAHVRTERHALAREGKATRLCSGCHLVTIPAWRHMCHGCRRDRERAEAAA